ncbi:MAG: putative toxin-antitoxin system toxin component, PIN family [Deltaproteobacteria bacterium RBG_16_49_23]|nr:MAG: putative toxin-antitoxin system toxin component, PIN family [Deltaproteobacteria bacterium RBG_16_49_23]
MRIFLDTNVLVSAVATRGLSADVLRNSLIHHQLVISDSLIKELEKALCNKLGVPENLTSELVEVLQKESVFSTPSSLPDIEIKDKDDLTILSCALNGKPDLFITGDKELLGLKRIGNMEIVSPRAFWEKLKTLD